MVMVEFTIVFVGCLIMYTLIEHEYTNRKK